jgi:hypothetical protein
VFKSEQFSGSRLSKIFGHWPHRAGVVVVERTEDTRRPTLTPRERDEGFVAKKIVQFLRGQPVPSKTICDENQPRPCGSPAMMVVRIDAEEHFFCYHHLSLLYNRVTRPRDPHRRRPAEHPRTGKSGDSAEGT